MFTCPITLLQQADVPEDSDDDDPDEVFGFITMLNLTERKVTALKTNWPLGPVTELKHVMLVDFLFFIFFLNSRCYAFVSAVGRGCSVWRR